MLRLTSYSDFESIYIGPIERTSEMINDDN